MALWSVDKLLVLKTWDRKFDPLLPQSVGLLIIKVCMIGNFACFFAVSS